MFQNIQQENPAKFPTFQMVDAGYKTVLQVARNVLFERAGLRRMVQNIHAGHHVAGLLQLLRHVAFAAADIQNRLMGPHKIMRVSMTGAAALLDWIVVEVFRKLRVALHRTAGLPVPPDGTEDIAGILQPIYITDFVAVIGGDRDFGDVKTLML